jgi:maltose O-acetyltransferase
MTIRKTFSTSWDTIKELARTLDKLLTFFIFYFDHYAVSNYLRRWRIASVGKNSWIATNVRFDLYKTPEAKALGRPIITIGNNCVITEYTQLIAHDASYNHFRKIHGLASKSKWGEIIIKDNAFVGAGCIILPGVTLGKGCLVGAGSVVTKDVEDGAIVAGNPAKKISTVQAYISKSRL